jgi:hypothetical protein
MASQYCGAIFVWAQVPLLSKVPLLSNICCGGGPWFPYRERWLIVAGGDTMKDMQEHLERLRVQTAECEMIRDLATDKAKREMFAKLAEHFKLLADELEKEIAKRSSVDTLSGSKTQDPFPKEDS